MFVPMFLLRLKTELNPQLLDIRPLPKCKFEKKSLKQYQARHLKLCLKRKKQKWDNNFEKKEKRKLEIEEDKKSSKSLLNQNNTPTET